MKRERLSAALTAAGAVLKRHKKHLVYALPNGKSLVVSATPGDAQAELNALADLRHALGGEARMAVVNPPREKRHVKRRTEDVRLPQLNSPLAAAMKTSGLQAESDLAKARDTERELRWRIFTLEGELAALNALWVVRCWNRLTRLWWSG